jgi:hypothetical protein
VGVATQVRRGVVGLGEGDGLATGEGLGDGDGVGIAGDSVAREGDGVGETWLVAAGLPQALTIEATPIAMQIRRRLTHHPTGR